MSSIETKNITRDKNFDLYSDSLKIKEREPWINEPRLRSWINTTWWTWGGAPTLGTHTIPMSTGTGSYDITSSNIWFTPKLVRLQAVMTLWNMSAYSDISMNWTTTSGAKYEWYDLSDDKWIWYDITRAIDLTTWDTSSTYYFRANFTELIDGWVRINVTSSSAVSSIKCTITAYK